MPETKGKTSKSLKDTEQIALEFFKKITKNRGNKATVVALSGELGAGKTAFTKALGKHIGIKRKINSPTFVIIKKYPIKEGQYKYLYHLDAYRLKSSKELEKLGWQEMVSSPEHLVLIEWPENVSKIMPKNHHRISIFHQKDGGRMFKVKIQSK